MHIAITMTTNKIIILKDNFDLILLYGFLSYYGRQSYCNGYRR